MTEVNLQPLWPFYQFYEQVYCPHSLGEICIQFQEKLTTHLISYAWCNLHWSQFNETYMYTIL